MEATSESAAWELEQPHILKYDDPRQYVVEYTCADTRVHVVSIRVICPRGYVYEITPEHMLMLRALTIAPSSNAETRCEQIPQDGQHFIPGRSVTGVKTMRRDIQCAKVRVHFSGAVKTARLILCDLPMPTYYIRLPQSSAYNAPHNPAYVIEPSCMQKYKSVTTYGCTIEPNGTLTPHIDNSVPQSVRDMITRNLPSNPPLTPIRADSVARDWAVYITVARM